VGRHRGRCPRRTNATQRVPRRVRAETKSLVSGPPGLTTFGHVQGSDLTLPGADSRCDAPRHQTWAAPDCLTVGDRYLATPNGALSDS
jgi:hypothetical protein